MPFADPGPQKIVISFHWTNNPQDERQRAQSTTEDQAIRLNVPFVPVVDLRVLPVPQSIDGGGSAILRGFVDGRAIH